MRLLVFSQSVRRESYRLQKFTIALILVCCTFPAWAEKFNLDIQTVVQMAISRGAGVSAKDAALQAREFDVSAAKTAWRPTVTAQASSLYGSGQPTSFFALQGISETDAPLKKSSGGYASGGLTLTIPLYQKNTWYLGNTPEVQQAQANFRKAEADRSQKVAEVASRAAKLYFSILQDQEELLVYQSAYEDSIHLKDFIAPRVKAGITGKGDLLSAISMVASDSAAFNGAKHKLDLDMALLNSYLALEPESAIKLKPLSHWIPELPELSVALNEASVHEPSIRGAESEVDLAQAKVSDMRAQSSPTLAMTSAATTASNLSSSTTPSFASVGIAFSMPILDFGANTKRVEAKGQGVTESKLKVVEQRETVKQNVLNAYYVVLRAVEKIEPLRTKVDYAEYQGKSAHERLVKGLVRLDEASKLTEVSNSARIELIKARYASWASFADLYQMIGKPYGEAIARGIQQESLGAANAQVKSPNAIPTASESFGHRIEVKPSNEGPVEKNFTTSGNDERADLQAGLDAYQSGNYPIALQKLVTLANKGEASAQLQLGVMNELGQGVPVNNRRAIVRYRQAANHGNAEAQYRLGLMYELGKGMARNRRTATKWYAKSAAQGHLPAKEKIAGRVPENFPNEKVTKPKLMPMEKDSLDEGLSLGIK